ncbi:MULTISPECIES: hypothetical protein [unclassified Streptococcus]|uniref:hypothetical protein n=1 Tax=unclassified Streptococcus TaxID=2608887 RepID=UPI000A76C51E|nr:MULTISPECIES: hypothetical protein [unclassified Streptococcus]
MMDEIYLSRIKTAVFQSEYYLGLLDDIKKLFSEEIGLTIMSKSVNSSKGKKQ